MNANKGLISTIYSYRRIRSNTFKRFYESNFICKLLLALGMACLTGLGAQLKIFLPFTPVPFTGQIFFVLLSGTLLGRYGGLSQAIYVGIGCLVVPWFAAGTGGGVEVLIGVTGGYLIGFIIASTIIGMFTERYLTARGLKFQLLIMLLGIGIIYVFGAIQFSLLMHTGFQKTMILAVIPFISLDILKAISTALISTAILPKKN
ncbi:biotin transport system substrate-specific component [Methanophagales archaeon]|nr:biotin transport system substrate-specific component [Methanophagales archaeon]